MNKDESPNWFSVICAVCLIGLLLTKLEGLI